MKCVVNWVCTATVHSLIIGGSIIWNLPLFLDALLFGLELLVVRLAHVRIGPLGYSGDPSMYSVETLFSSSNAAFLLLLLLLLFCLVLYLIFYLFSYCLV